MKKPPMIARMMPATALLHPKRAPLPKRKPAEVQSHAYNWRSRAGLKRGSK